MRHCYNYLFSFDDVYRFLWICPYINTSMYILSILDSEWIYTKYMWLCKIFKKIVIQGQAAISSLLVTWKTKLACLTTFQSKLILTSAEWVRKISAWNTFQSRNFLLLIFLGLYLYGKFFKYGCLFACRSIMFCR